jgi:hypothetical protein
MPLLAGSPGLSEPKGEGCIGGLRNEPIPEVTSDTCAVGARVKGGVAHPRHSIGQFLLS